MTTNELIEALSYHGWLKMEGREAMKKGDLTFDVWGSEEHDNLCVTYTGYGLSFICPIEKVDISDNKLTADVYRNKVEVWI